MSDPMKNEPCVTEALLPFAQFADALNEAVPEDIALGIFAEGAMRFGPSGCNVGDLRRARAALSAAANSQPKPGEVGEPAAWLRLEADDNETASWQFYPKSVEGGEPLYTADALSASHARADALQAERDEARELLIQVQAESEASVKALQAEVDRLTAERDEALDDAKFAERIAVKREVDAEARLATVEKEAAELREDAQYVHDRFVKDIQQGYRTKDKEFAVSILSKGLARASLHAGETT